MTTIVTDKTVETYTWTRVATTEPPVGVDIWLWDGDPTEDPEHMTVCEDRGALVRATCDCCGMFVERFDWISDTDLWRLA